jgi:shikimate kinase
LLHFDRILLTGFMGSGKTTTGALLAERLGWRFVDLDHEIERTQSRTVAEIFAQDGEAHFRQLETDALTNLLAETNLVLALGGGAPETATNQLLLTNSRRTAIIHLAAPLEVLLARCLADRTVRPNLPIAAERFATRHPIYQRLATHTLDTTTLTPEAAVATLLTALETGNLETEI